MIRPRTSMHQASCFPSLPATAGLRATSMKATAWHAFPTRSTVTSISTTTWPVDWRWSTHPAAARSATNTMASVVSRSWSIPTARRAASSTRTLLPQALTGIVDETGARWRLRLRRAGRAIEHRTGRRRRSLPGQLSGRRHASRHRSAGHLAQLPLRHDQGQARRHRRLACPRHAARPMPLRACRTPTARHQRDRLQGRTHRHHLGCRASPAPVRHRAAGTPEARTVTTQWHADLRPAGARHRTRPHAPRITYDAQGNMLSRTLTHTATRRRCRPGTGPTTPRAWSPPRPSPTARSPRYTYDTLRQSDQGRRMPWATKPSTPMTAPIAL